MIAARNPIVVRAAAVPSWVWVALLCVLAFVLRAVLVTDALAGDELFARYDVIDGSLGDVIDRLQAGDWVSPEVSPPLYFVLAWVTHGIFGTDEALRIPSLLCSTATVWLVYAIGRRAFGTPAGVLAAAMWTFSPFAIFYGSEARPYGLLAFVCAASLLTLLVALERGGWWRWALVAITSSAVVYTHYTGVGLVVLQAAWAFVAHPPARRAIVATYVVAAVSFLPWIGELRTDALYSYDVVRPRSVQDVLERFARALPGHPFVLLRSIPGFPLLGVFVAAAGAAIVGTVIQRGRSAGAWVAMLRSPQGAVLLAAISTPLALLIFSLVDRYTVFLVRSFNSSLPATIVLLAGLACALRPPWARATTGAAMVAVLLFGAMRTLDPDTRRPDYGTVAAYIDRTARPGDLVVHSTIAVKHTALDQVLDRELDTPLTEEFLGIPSEDARIWGEAQRSSRVYLVVSREEPWVRARPPVTTGLVEVGRGPTARGWTPVDVFVYEHPRQ